MTEAEIASAVEEALDHVSDAVERARSIRQLMTRAGIPLDRRTLAAMAALAETLESALEDAD